MVAPLFNYKNPLSLSVILIGVGGMIGQLMLIRVLMVIFLGNELSMSLVIASWLLFEGLGSFLGGVITKRKRINLQALFISLLTLYPILLGGATFLARYLSQGMPGLVPGEAMSVGHMIFTSILTVGVTGITHGSLFPFAAQLFQQDAQEQSVSRAYIIEIIGTIGGGLIFVFLLTPFFNEMQITMGLLILHLPISFWLWMEYTSFKGKRVKITVFSVAIILLLVLFPGITSFFHETSIGGLWREGEITGYYNSPYGNIVILTRQDEITVLYDGRPIMALPHPDTAMLKDYAYLATLSHPQPDDVLLLGGGLGGTISFLLDHPLENLVFAEIDPKLLQVVRDIDSELTREEFADERTEIINQDGRLFLNRTGRKFDLIILGQMETETLQTNRFFTREFFQVMEERLKEEGKVVFSLPGALNYLGGEMALLNSSLYRTAGEVFEEVKLIPGDQNIMVAANQEINLAPEVYIERLQERELYGGMFSTGYVNFRLDPYRIEEFNRKLEGYQARINLDFFPSGFLFGLMNWASTFAPESLNLAYSVFDNLQFIIPVVLVIIFLLGWRLLFASRFRLANRITCAIATSGGAAMAFDIFTLFAFQSLFGHIYQLNGLFIAAVMGGMFFGARLGYKKVLGEKKNLFPIFLNLEVLVILLLAAFPALVYFLRELMFLPGATVIAATTCVIFAAISGAIIGGQFPLASNLLPGEYRYEAGLTAGRLYTADLIGGWFGGIFVGLLLFPLLGLTVTLILLAIIKLTSWSLLKLSWGEKIKGGL